MDNRYFKSSKVEESTFQNRIKIIKFSPVVPKITESHCGILDCFGHVVSPL